MYASQNTIDYIEKEKLIAKALIAKGKHIVFHDWSDITQVVYKNKPEDILILVSARKGTISYQLDLDKMPDKIAKLFPISNFIIAYPEQKKAKIQESLIQANDIDTTHINQNLRRIDVLRKKLRNIFK